MKNVRVLVTMAMLSALSILLVALIRFPIFPALPFMEYEPGDVPMLLAAMMFGPVPALAVTAVTAAIQAFTVSAGAGWIGVVMHMLASGALVLTAGLVYKINPSPKYAVLGLFLGTLAMTVTMALWNMIFTPIFMGWPRDEVMPLILPFIVPFNLIKAGVNSALAFGIFSALERVVKQRFPGV